MDLLLAAPGQTVFWQPQKRIAVCSPPKVGTSFSHSWLVWSEVSAETACKYGVQQLSSEAKQFCADAGIAKTGDLYAPHNFESLVMHRGHLRALLPADHRDWRLFVLARDPWSRLMSGFSNKILGISGHSANKTNHVTLREIHNFIPSLDARAASHNETASAKLAMVLRALAERPALPNPHFARQSDLCLHRRFEAVLQQNSTRVAAIDRGGFDDVSEALGHGRSGALSAQHLFRGAEPAAAAVQPGRRLPEARVGCLCVATELLLRVYREFLAADYAALARFGLEYPASQSALNRSALGPRRARVCGYAISYEAECVDESEQVFS